MRRRIGSLALGAALGAMAVFGAAAGAPGADVLDAKREQVRALSAELSAIDRQTGEAADGHARAGERLVALRERIERNGAASRRAAVAGGRAQERLERRLVDLYTQPSPGPVEVLLASGSLRDAVAVHDLQRRAGHRDGLLVGELRASRERLRETRVLLVRERDEAARTRREAAQRLSELEDLLARRSLVLERAESALEGVIAERERAAAVARARQAAEGDARRRAQPRENPTNDPAPAAETSPEGTPASEPPTPQPQSEPDPPPPSSGGDGPIPGGPSYSVLARIAQCESGGNPRAVSASGQYRGKYQFDRQTWASVGGSGDPAEASPGEQDLRAAMLYQQRGPAPWPVCGYR